MVKENLHEKALQILAFVVMLSISAFAQGSSSISGEVLIKGQPAPNVKVSLLSIRTGQMPTIVARARTDAEGKFSFKGIAGGSYQVRPFLPGYCLENMTVPDMSIPVSIGEGDSAEGLKFRMTKGGVITGKVTDADGKPVVRERIEVRRVGPNREPTFMALMGNTTPETDDRGIYRIYGLQAGNYLVSAGSDNARGQFGWRKSYLKVYYQGKTTPQEAELVKVTEGDETTGIDIKFGEDPVTYTISGKIIGVSGEPVPGVRLMAMRKVERMTSSFAGPEMSGPDGAFSISGILPGQYTLSTIVPEGGEQYSDAVELDVSSADVSGVELRMRNGSSISGKVVIEGTTDPKVIATLLKAVVNAYSAVPSAGAPNSVRAQVDTGGSFRLTGLRPGPVRLQVYGAQTNLGQLKLRVERDGVVIDDPRRQSAEIEIKAGEHISGIRIVISYGTGAIRGKLIVVGGELPPDARLIVSLFAFEPSLGQYFPSGQSLMSTNTFFFENLVAGQYEVRVSVLQSPIVSSQRVPLMFKSEPVTVSSDKAEQVTIEVNLSSKPR